MNCTVTNPYRTMAVILLVATAGCLPGIDGSTLLAQNPFSSPSETTQGLETDEDSKSFVPGRIEALDQAEVSAKEAGQLLALDVRENAQVTKDQVLAQIDDAVAKMTYFQAGYDWEAAKLEAESEIEIHVSEKSRDVAQASLEDAIEANKRSNSPIFTEAELRRRKFEVERADGQLEFSHFKQQQAKVAEKSKLAQLKQATEKLARHKVIAPIQGEVTEVKKHAGEWVNPGDPVLTIVRMDKLQAKGFVKVEDWPRQQLVRRPVEIVVKAPGGGTETFKGTITRLGSIVEGAHEYMIWAEIDNRREGDTWVITPGLDAEIKLN
ncbi:MAG: HlyD family efflux transporter periplasmic adaptor subunit [Pirellulales bacterium]